MKIDMKTGFFYSGVLLLLFTVFSAINHRRLSQEFITKGEWDAAFSKMREERQAREEKFNELWNNRIETQIRNLNAKQAAYDKKHQEVERSFAETEKRFQERFERLKRQKERERAYPFSQRMTDIAKRWDAQTKVNWEKHKNATLTQWGWIKEQPSQDDIHDQDHEE